MGGRTSRLARSISAAAMAMLLAGCSALPWTENEPQLYSPVFGSVAVGMSGMRPGTSLSLGDIPLCVDVPGTVVITAVEPVNSLNATTVTDFAVRTIPPGDAPLGNAFGGLVAMGLNEEQQKNRLVSNVCGAQARANVGLEGPPPSGTVELRVDLVVTVTAPTFPAGAEALRIHYQDASGSEHSTVSAFAITMCAGKSTDPCPSE